MFRSRQVAMSCAVALSTVSPFAIQTSTAAFPIILNSSHGSTQLTITGSNLTGGAAIVTLGSFGPLEIISQSATSLVVSLPSDITPGNYLLTVQIGAEKNFDESVVTVVGAVELPAARTASGISSSVGPRPRQEVVTHEYVESVRNAAGAGVIAGSAIGEVPAEQNTLKAGPANINVAGNITLAESTASVGNILKGTGVLFVHNFGPFNAFFGENAGNLSMTGNSNVGIGWSALKNSTTGSQNTANGVAALSANTAGNNNTANGGGALQFNTTGNQNTAAGTSRLITIRLAVLIRRAEALRSKAIRPALTTPRTDSLRSKGIRPVIKTRRRATSRWLAIRPAVIIRRAECSRSRLIRQVVRTRQPELPRLISW